MDKRKMENIGAEPSMLGFGCMRFPTLEDGSINEAEAEKMLKEGFSKENMVLSVVR